MKWRKKTAKAKSSTTVWVSLHKVVHGLFNYFLASSVAYRYVDPPPHNCWSLYGLEQFLFDFFFVAISGFVGKSDWIEIRFPSEPTDQSGF